MHPQAGLNINNSGSKPTFIRTNCASTIDITLSTMFLNQRLLNWKVIDDYTGLDHKYLSYEFDFNRTYALTPSSPRKTNWNKYREHLALRLSKLDHELIIFEKADEIATNLNEIIMNTFHENCKEQKAISNRKEPWWNFHLAKLNS